ncbi:dienelactone hydrolase family protein [Sorangium sp. So ce834]
MARATGSSPRCSRAPGSPRCSSISSTGEEEAADERTGHLRFDVELLAGRVLGAALATRELPETSALRLGYFGASTGAAAALIAAAERPDLADAVVSRGGRPALAGAYLEQVRAPTLLLVGGEDIEVLALNRQALEHLHGPRQLAIVEGATHLFEEPGTLEEVARAASAWFVRYLRPGSSRRPRSCARPPPVYSLHAAGSQRAKCSSAAALSCAPSSRTCRSLLP